MQTSNHCKSVSRQEERVRYLLDGGAHVAEPHVDACLLEPGLGGVLDRLDQLVVLGVEVHREGAVHDPATDVRPEINLFSRTRVRESVSVR